MQVKNILETALYVNDLGSAEFFYTQVLGLKLNSKKEGRHVFLECNNRMLLLFNPDETIQTKGDAPPHGANGQGHIAFEIPAAQFEEWKQYLQENNVPIEKEISWDTGGTSIYFRDPSGNSIELTTPSIWGLKE